VRYEIVRALEEHRLNAVLAMVRAAHSGRTYDPARGRT
jgi:hypothetical protein